MYDFGALLRETTVKIPIPTGLTDRMKKMGSQIPQIFVCGHLYMQ